MKKIRKFWKKLKYWQKGFIVGSILHLLYFSIFIPWILSGGGESGLGWGFGLTEALPVIFIFRFLESFLLDSIVGLFVTGLIMTLLYGLIGALIGLIIGKLKKK